MIPSSPEDMDVNSNREHAFRRGYISGIYDALLGVKNRLSQSEYDRLETWIVEDLRLWAITNLDKAVRPPLPSDPALSPNVRKHGDGPFILR